MPDTTRAIASPVRNPREEWITWLVAFAIAIGLYNWVQVIKPRVIENQVLPLTIEESGRVAVASAVPLDVTVTFDGTRNDINAYLAGNPVVRLDLARAVAGAGQRFPLTLSETLPAGMSATLDPPAWLVDLQPLATDTYKPVLVAEGELQEGLHHDTTEGVPDLVRVTGPEMRVREVTGVVYRVDLSKLEGRAQQTITFVPVDANGIQVPFVVPEPAQAQATFWVQRKSEQLQVPIIVRLINEPAAGYMVVQMEVEPDLVTVRGTARELRRIPNIFTEPVDVRDITTDLTRTNVTLATPPGTKITLDPATVRVTIRVQPLPARRQVAPVIVRIDGTQPALKYKLEPPSLTLGVEGEADRLATLGEDQFRAVLDVAGFGIGKHEIPVEQIVIQSPSGVAITRREPITVTLTVTGDGG